MKRYAFSIVFVSAIAIFGMFVYAFNTPGNGSQFETGAADPGLSSFSEYFRAEVISVIKPGVENEYNIEQNQELALYDSKFFTVRILEGTHKGHEVEVENNSPVTSGQPVELGDTIVAAELSTAGDSQFVYIDQYRLQPVLILLLLFLVLAIIFGRIRGLTALLGLGFSIFVLMYILAPGIVDGKNAILLSLATAGLIALVSIFFGHGLNERSAVATISSLLTLGLAGVLSYTSIYWTKLFGLGTESAFYLQSGFLGSIDLRGLLFAGIIIGTIGILDDITTAQTAAIGEIHEANKSLGFKELFSRGSVIGREHIGSLVNSLVLAYAGTSFPFFLLFTLIKDQPLWAVLNSEFVAEEIVRALMGSIALVIAVPLTSLLASYYFSRSRQSKTKII